MTANVKVSRDFVHIERALNHASVLVAESFFDHLVLLILVFYSQQLEILIVYELAIAIDSKLLDRADVALMVQHFILQVKRNNLAGVPRQLYVYVYSTLTFLYSSCSRVKAISLLKLGTSGGFTKLANSVYIK